MSHVLHCVLAQSYYSSLDSKKYTSFASCAHAQKKRQQQSKHTALAERRKKNEKEESATTPPMESTLRAVWSFDGMSDISFPPEGAALVGGLGRTCIGIALGAVMNLTFAHRYPTAEHGRTDGLPNWSFYSAWFYQGLFLPLCLLGLLFSGDKDTLDVSQITRCSWENAGTPACGSMVWESLIVHFVSAYFWKDLMVIVHAMITEGASGALFIVHHFVCLAGNVLLFYFPKSGGITAFAIGIVFMELGSFVMSLSVVDPTHRGKYVLFKYGMTVSNIIGGIILPTILFTYSECGWRQVLLVVTSIVLCILRQDFLHKVKPPVASPPTNDGKKE